MTMQYDILGNPIGDDGQPSIDQMQYELAKNGKPSPLDTAVNAIKNVAINNNPLMLRKQGIDLAGDIPRVMASGVAPYIAGITQPVVGAYQYASKMPGVLYREKVLGDPESMQEAATIRAGLPQFAPPGARYNPEPMNQRIEAIGQAVAPQTPQGQTVLEGATQVFEPLKLPMIGPGSGLPGTSRVSPRPFITPNDVRVLGAEATRVGRQIGEIPTDFVNAQSGLQRIDPVTGQPVLGARIQSGVDRLGDIMEQRKMQGLTPIPGLPAALQPETSMYAVRPQGTKLTVPTVPASAKGYVPDIDPIESLFRDINIDVNEPTATPDVIDSLIDKQMKSADNPNQARSAFNYFLEEKARGVYPDAPNGAQALQALKVSLYGSGQMVPKINSLYDEFLNTEQGKEFLPNAVQTSELAERHDAAVEGLKNMWGKYLVKNLGTEGNPAVRMAAQEGLTYLPAEDVLDLAQRERSTAQSHRRNAGVPIEGSFVADINALSNEIEAFNLPIKNAANAEKSLLEQRNTAINLAKQDPSMEAHAKELDALHKTAKKTATNLTRQKADLQKKLDKLRLAEAYETLEDAYVAPIDAKTLLEKIPYAEQQFYPDLKEAAKRGEMAYKAYDRRFKGIGIVDAAQQFYNDVITGNIPKDKAPTLPVDRYLHETAKARIQDVQAYRTNVLNMIKTEATAIPENKKFGNVGVIELTRDTPEDIANKEAALSTEALDICIGEGGGGDGTRNFFTKKKDPRWTPIVDIYTGKPNPNASRHTTSYVQSIYSGGELPMFRDLETGMPVAALQFLPSSSVGVNGQPRFNIGYASGESNGRIETKYVNGIRDYLNSRADDIAGIGDRLEANAGIYDTKNRTSLSTARRAAQVSENDMKGVDWNAMPRFMTAEDVKQAVKSNVPAVIPQQTPAFQEDIGQLQTALVDNIEFVVNEAIQNSNLDAPEELERRLGIVFSAMQSQYFPTLLTDPISSLNRALEYLEYEIDRRSNNASELSQEMVTALERYSAELESARDDLVSQQQRAQQPAPQALAPQAQMQQAEQLLQQIERPLRSANDGIVNDALQEYARSLQRYASNQLQNGMDPITVANGMRDTINTLRNIVLTQPTDPTRNFMTDQLGEYVSALRLAIDGIGQWIESQQQQVPVQPQRANLPAEVQQNADQRNQDISNAYLNALIPNTNIGIIDQSLSEFADLLHDMSTNMFGNGLNTAEIVDRLQDRIRTEITELSNTDRVMNRGLNVAEADMIRSRLNDAYGNLNMIREMGVPAPEQLPDLNFEPDTTHPANQPAQSPQRTVFDATVGNFINRQIQELRDVGTPAATNAIDNVLSTIATVAASANMFNDPQEAVRLFRQGATAWGNAAARQALNNIARAVELNHPTMQAEVPANEPYTMQSAVDMARDLFEQERIDANNFDIRSIEDSIYALREGLFDDERIRRLSPRQQASFSEDVAFRLQNMLDELRGRRPDQNLVADPADARRAIDNAIANIDNDYGIDVANDVSMITNAISEHINPGDELSEYVYQLRRGRPGMSEDVREALDHVAEELESIATERQQQTQPMDLNTAYNTAEAYLNERLEDIGLDDRFADLTDAERAGIVNTYEDELGRTLNGLSDDDFLHVLRRLRENNPIPQQQQQQVQPVLPAPATAPYRPIPVNITAMSDQAITADMSEYDRTSVQSMFEALTDVNSPEELQNIVSLARSYAMGGWDNFSDVQREWLARNIEEYIGDNPPPNTPPPEVDNVFGVTGQTLRITDRDRELYTELNDMLDNAIEEGYPLPDLGDNEAVARLILNNEVGGEIENATDAERRRLASLVRRYGAHGTLPRGHKDGGRIRKYQDGGSIAEESNKQIRELRQPEPRPDPATGRFPIPDISRMPERTMVLPRFMHFDKDYPAVGTRLSANKRLDNNSMVTGYVDADTTKSPGERPSTRASGVGIQFMHTFAKGGTVQPIPSVEQMKRELMMRRA